MAQYFINRFRSFASDVRDEWLSSETIRENNRALKSIGTGVIDSNGTIAIKFGFLRLIGKVVVQSTKRRTGTDKKMQTCEIEKNGKTNQRPTISDRTRVTGIPVY